MSTPQFRRAPATVVGVDVTAHKEERHITDAKKSGKKSNTRVRYYVELIVGSPRESHTRLGFSGTFKALLRLHKAFEAIFNAKYAPLKAAASTRESLYSVTSASSSSSSSPPRRRTISIPSAPGSATDSGHQLPKILPFPTSNPLLVKLQPRHAESDDKSRARCDALFAYFTSLFNSDERELYLDYVQGRAENVPIDNQHEDNAAAAVGSSDNSARGAGGFLKKLFSKRDPSPVDAAPKSERQRVSAMDAQLEFAAPVHVQRKSSRR